MFGCVKYFKETITAGDVLLQRKASTNNFARRHADAFLQNFRKNHKSARSRVSFC